MDRRLIMSRYPSHGQSELPTLNRFCHSEPQSGESLPCEAERNLLFADSRSSLDSVEYRRVPHPFALFAKGWAAPPPQSTIG
jgi:hypothetical protein